MNTNPIFIVGMNGSGTTMLLDCLSGHRSIFGFVEETRVLPHFIKSQHKFGDLQRNANFVRLWRDLDKHLAQLGWPCELHEKAIPNWGTRPRNVGGIVDFVMSSLAAQENKTIWCEKTPMHVHHIGLLSREFPGARFLHVIRDGRDCAASFHRRWGFHPVRTAYRWKTAVRAGRGQGKLVGSQYLEVSYESLTSNPTEVLQDVCLFLRVSNEENLHRLARHRPEMTGSSQKSVCANPRQAKNYFDEKTILNMEKVAGACLVEFNYKVSMIAGDFDPTRLQRFALECRDYLLRVHAVVLRTLSIKRSKRWAFFSRRIINALLQRLSLLR